MVEFIEGTSIACVGVSSSSITSLTNSALMIDKRPVRQSLYVCIRLTPQLLECAIRNSGQMSPEPASFPLTLS